MHHVRDTLGTHVRNTSQSRVICIMCVCVCVWERERERERECVVYWYSIQNLYSYHRRAQSPPTHVFSTPPLTNVFSSTPTVGGHSLLLLKCSLRLLLLLCSPLHRRGYAARAAWYQMMWHAIRWCDMLSDDATCYQMMWHAIRWCGSNARSLPLFDVDIWFLLQKTNQKSAPYEIYIPKMKKNYRKNLKSQRPTEFTV